MANRTGCEIGTGFIPQTLRPCDLEIARGHTNRKGGPVESYRRHSVLDDLSSSRSFYIAQTPSKIPTEHGPNRECAGGRENGIVDVPKAHK